MLRIGSAFSGIGSAEQGIKELKIPYVIKFACENEPKARAVYMNNFYPEIFFEDWDKFIQDNSWHILPDVDLFVADPPNDKKKTYFKSIYKYLQTKKPLAFIFNLSIRGSKELLSQIIDECAVSIDDQMLMFPEDNAEYHCYIKDLKGSEFGVPYDGRKIFIVGIREGFFKFPEPYDYKVAVKDILEDIPMESLMGKKLMMDIPLDELDPNGGFLSASEIITKRERRKNKNMVRISPPDRPLLSPSTKRFCSGFGITRVNERIRGYSLKEAYRIFGFPDSFVKIESKIGYDQVLRSGIVPIYKELVRNIVNGQSSRSKE